MVRVKLGALVYFWLTAKLKFHGEYRLSSDHTSKVAFVLKGYPRLSETFIAQEILALEERGLSILIVSLRHPTDTKRHPVHDRIQAPLLYLPEYVHDEPIRVIKSFLAARKRPGFRKSLSVWWRDFRRDTTRNRFRRFAQALVLASELPTTVEHLHAHFLHTPASVVRYTSLIRGIPWTCSAHAKDIWTIDDWEIKEKLTDLEWLVTCTRFNTDHLKSLARHPDKVQLVYHGLDLSRFHSQHSKDTEALRDGTDSANPVRLISVGRAVPKKGYDILMHALAQVPDTLHWRFTHIGNGPELDALKSLAGDLKISTSIEWLGSQSQETVIESYRNSDLFVLPCRITADGDRDGLPNVLVEAQSQGLACVSTRISGVPELIDEDVNGVLVDQNDIAGLADALTRLIMNPKQRSTMAANGVQRVKKDFDMNSGIDELAKRFGIPEDNLIAVAD